MLRSAVVGHSDVSLARPVTSALRGQCRDTRGLRRAREAQELRPWAKWTVLVCGHVGALARGALFCFVSVLMIRVLHGYTPDDPNLETEGAALNQLTVRPWPLAAPCAHT